jgi:hypothetical protein
LAIGCWNTVTFPRFVTSKSALVPSQPVTLYESHAQVLLIVREV